MNGNTSVAPKISERSNLTVGDVSHPKKRSKIKPGQHGPHYSSNPKGHRMQFQPRKNAATSALIVYALAGQL